MENFVVNLNEHERISTSCEAAIDNYFGNVILTNQRLIFKGKKDNEYMGVHIEFHEIISFEAVI